MLRAVVAVALAAALLATSLPALETAQRQRTATHLGGEVDRLATAIADLRAREQATVGHGARRVVAVRLPQRDWTHAAVGYLAIGGRPRESDAVGNGATFAWRARGGGEQWRRTPGVRVAPVETCGGRPIVLREPGVHRIALELGWRDGERRILARRLG